MLGRGAHTAHRHPTTHPYMLYYVKLMFYSDRTFLPTPYDGYLYSNGRKCLKLLLAGRSGTKGPDRQVSGREISFKHCKRYDVDLLYAE